MVSSLRAAPRPGYGLAARSHTFSSSTGVSTAPTLGATFYGGTGRAGYSVGRLLQGEFTFGGLGALDTTHSTDFSSGKSDSEY